jgi:hypothetical protein
MLYRLIHCELLQVLNLSVSDYLRCGKVKYVLLRGLVKVKVMFQAGFLVKFVRSCSLSMGDHERGGLFLLQGLVAIKGGD